MTTGDLRWVDVEPLPKLNGDVESVLASVRSLQHAWRSVVASHGSAFQEARRRSLRRHAIETGIIERLYDVGWGVTEALVAEGITAEAVARADETISHDVLTLIQSQYDAQDTPATRWEDVEDILDTTLAAALQKFTSSLA